MVINEPLKIAFVGGAVESSAVGYAHYVAAKMDHRWQLHAGCFSQNQQQNLMSAQTYGVPEKRIYPDLSTLLMQEKTQLDAVAILTPTPTHADMVMQVLSAGIPVICEKALASNVADIELMSKGIKNQASQFLAVTYNYVGYPMVRVLRHLIETGQLGQLLHIQIEMPQESFIKTDSAGERMVPQSWRLQDGEVPTIYLDLGVHLHHLVHYLTGAYPQEVLCHQSSHGSFFDVVDNVNAIVRYSNQMSCDMWFSKCALGNRNGLRVRVLGSEGSADWLQVQPEELRVANQQGRIEVLDRGCYAAVVGETRYQRFKPGHPDGYLEAFANLYYDLADAVIEYQQSGQWQAEKWYGLQPACAGLQMMEAMVQSHLSRQWQVVV